MYDPTLAHTLNKLKGAALALDEQDGDERHRLARAWRELIWVRSRDLPMGPWRDDFRAMNLRLGGRADPRPLPVDELSEEEVARLASEVRSFHARLTGVGELDNRL